MIETAARVLLYILIYNNKINSSTNVCILILSIIFFSYEILNFCIIYFTLQHAIVLGFKYVRTLRYCVNFF